jgi:hypothetical protein
VCCGSFHAAFHGGDRQWTSSRPSVLGEVGVVLDVEGRQGQFADEKAGGDPGVVGRTWATAELRVDWISPRRVATRWS